MIAEPICVTKGKLNGLLENRIKGETLVLYIVSRLTKLFLMRKCVPGVEVTVAVVIVILLVFLAAVKMIIVILMELAIVVLTVVIVTLTL